jgi:hypothetical protein
MHRLFTALRLRQLSAAASPRATHHVPSGRPQSRRIGLRVPYKAVAAAQPQRAGAEGSMACDADGEVEALRKQVEALQVSVGPSMWC